MRTVGFMIGWLAASAAAVALAWSGVSVVSGDAGETTPSADIPGADVPGQSSPTQSIAPAPGTGSVGDEVSSVVGQPETITLTTIGGQAEFSVASDSVFVVWAVSYSGFTAQVDSGGTRAVVDFSSSEHRSVIEVWWDNGPKYDLNEEG